MLALTRVMTEDGKQNWESVRLQGHTRYILRSFLSWGVPFAVFVVLGPLLYDAVFHKLYQPHILPWPVADIVFDFALSVLIFGYLMGEDRWRKHERDYAKSRG